MTWRGGRAMRTSGERGGGNCWEMKSEPFYVLGRPSRNCKRRRNVCSTWQHDIQEVTERTVQGEGGDAGAPCSRPRGSPGRVHALRAFNTLLPGHDEGQLDARSDWRSHLTR